MSALDCGLARVAALAALLVALAAAPAWAQGGGSHGRGGRGAAVEQLLRRRVGLTDAQIGRLRATRQSFAPERMALARRERAIADSLRGHIDARSGDEPAVSALITRLFGVRRERLALREREQTALAAFMTPSQRAMLLGLEEEAQRRASAMRGQRRRGGRS